MTATTRRRIPPRVLLAALLVVAVVLGAFGIVGIARAHDLRSSSAAENAALADPAATSEVEGQVSTALTRLLTFDYQDAGPTNSAADQYLTGDAEDQYQVLLDALNKNAAGQKLSLKASVVASGVKSLVGDSAELLVFVNQTSTRDSDKAATFAAAQLAISAKKVDGSWKISGINPI